MATAATWAGYSVAIAPLMARYSASRISAVVLGSPGSGSPPAARRQTVDQDYGFGWEVWALLVFATLGPLVLTNILWFRSLSTGSAPRARRWSRTCSPFLAAVFALVLLDERMTLVQVVGGVADRRRDPARARRTGARARRPSKHQACGRARLHAPRRAGTTSSSRSATRSRRRSSTSTRSASRAPPTRGPETGVRDRASYVLEQGDIRLVLTSGLRPDSEITRFACAHGDGVKDVALTVPDAGDAYREAVAARSARRRRAALGRGRATAASSSRRSRPTARTSTRSSTAPSYSGPFLPGSSARSPNGSRGDRRRAAGDRPRRRQRRARPDGLLGRVLRARRWGSRTSSTSATTRSRPSTRR